MPATRTPSRLSTARCRTSGWSEPTVTNRVRSRRAAARPRQAAIRSKKALRIYGMVRICYPLGCVGGARRIVVGLVVGTLAGIYLSLRASRLEPVEALRY